MQRIFSRVGVEIHALWSLALLALVVAGVGWQFPVVYRFFMESPYLNGVIIAGFLFAVLYTLFSFLRLQGEFGALRDIERRFQKSGDSFWMELGNLQALPASMARERLAFYAEQVKRGAEPDSETHMERVASSLQMRSNLLRYVTGLLVFLGLLGTFVGLLMAIGSVRDLIFQMPSSGEAATAEASFLENLKSQLTQPLAGMATAFSTSVFGLTTSLIVGFLHLHLSAAQHRFITLIDSFDSVYVRPAYAGRRSVTLPSAADGAESGRYLAAAQRVMGENLDKLIQVAERTEGMQAHFREVMVTLSREMELTNTAIGRLASNQDMIREASGNLVELTQRGTDNNRAMLKELQALHETFGRLNALLKEGQSAQQEGMRDMARSIKQEIDILKAMAVEDLEEE